MPKRSKSIRVDRVKLIRVAEQRLRKLDADHRRAVDKSQKDHATYQDAVVVALEKALDQARRGKLPKANYSGELAVPCKPKPKKLPKRSRDACDLERTIATLRIGATDDVQLSPNEAAYYFGPCEV